MTVLDMLNLTRFKHCPSCGSEALETLPGGKFVQCGDCGFEYAHSPAPASAAIIEHDGRILLTRRARAPHPGLLAVPGGFVDYAETLEDALAREVREELNLSVASQRYLTSEWGTYLYRDVVYITLVCFFVVEPAGLEGLTAGDDAAGVEWVTPEEAPGLELAFESDRRALAKYAAWRKGGKRA